MVYENMFNVIKNSKGQAMVEYVVILATVALGFVFVSEVFERSIMFLFMRIGEFLSRPGP